MLFSFAVLISSSVLNSALVLLKKNIFIIYIESNSTGTIITMERTNTIGRSNSSGEFIILVDPGAIAHTAHPPCRHLEAHPAMCMKTKVDGRQDRS